MIIDIMKSETLTKPSRVSFRKISESSMVSVKRYDNQEVMMSDEFQWYHNGREIRESRAHDILKEAGVKK